MDFGSGKKATKKDNDALDDLLGDLLSDDSPRRKKNDPPTSRQRAEPGKGARQGGKEDNFYSSLAAMAESDGDDISEADVGKVAHSLGGLDDMDADLFGDALNKKSNTSRSGGKSTTPRRTPRSKGAKSPNRVQSPTRSETPTSPPGSARGSLKRKPQKPPSPSTTAPSPSFGSPPQAQPEHKPGTAPGKMSDLSSASESLIPGQRTLQRPETAPKLKKKYDFGDFDPDDPLAGVLSDDQDDISESDRPRSAIKKSTPQASISKALEEGEGKMSEKVSNPESPRRRNMMDRPPTRSGSNNADNSAAGTGTFTVTNDNTKSAPKPQGGGIFSDSDGDLLDGLGLEGDAVASPKKTSAVQKSKGDSEDLKPARSVFDSLLGKGTSSAAQLLQPKEKKQFVLDTKYSASLAGSGDGKDEEEDFQFGSYQPSAASGSRPGSRRSVRFQDDDDIFGLESRPSPRAKSPGAKNKPPLDMDWLELAASKSATPTTSTISTPAVPTAATTSSPAPNATTTGNTTVPPTASKPPPATKPPESPRKTVGGAKDNAASPKKTPSVANSGPSPRAWLGLETSESDEELFKPKKDSARSATLPQSPALSTHASPRVLPKKSLKKDSSSPKGSPAVSVTKDSDDDDWLARARSRRQQMLSKEEGKGTEDTGTGRSDGGVKGNETEGQSMKVDLSSLIMDSPKVGGSARNDLSTDRFATPQGHSSGGLTWDSPRTALSKTLSGQLQGGTQTSTTVQSQPPAEDPRLKFSASTFGQDQLSSKTGFNIEGSLLSQHPQQQPQASQLQQQQNQLFQQQQFQQQQQYNQLQEQKKSQLLQQQQQLQHMLQDIQSQYDSVNKMQPPPSSLNMPSYSQITAQIQLPDSLQECHAKIRKLELEKNYTESLLDSIKRRYEEEMFAVETSYKNRLQIVEDSNRKKEARLREENEELMQQHLSKVRLLEQEKSDVSTGQYRKLEELEIEKAKEMEKLKEQHRLAISAVKREHEEALESLAKAKNFEISMVANANDTSKSLTAVVEQIQNNARDLGELQIKVESWNRQGLDEREISLRSKDEQLRMLQERLNRQEEDNERERKRLEELIARMETQLREQTRTMEEERWKLKQDSSRLEAQQRALEEERRMWLEQQARERTTMERARDSYLEEQRNSMASISEERRQLTEERTKFQVEQKTIREKLQHDAIKRGQAQADYEVLMRTIEEEKSHHTTRMQELKREEERMSGERTKLEREKNQLEQEQEKLAKQARQIREQSEQIDHVTEAARRTQIEGEQAMEESLQFNSQMERREMELQKQHNGLKLMEDHISQEKLRLAKEKKEVENLKSSSLCTNCRSPLHGGSLGPIPHQNGYHTPQYIPPPGQHSVHLINLSASAHQPGTNPLDHIASSIANDRAVRMMKIQAIKDKEFLDEESIYLESLRHTPYHSTTSKS